MANTQWLPLALQKKNGVTENELLKKKAIFGTNVHKKETYKRNFRRKY